MKKSRRTAASHAKDMVRIREDKAARGECRQCPSPAAICPKTGRTLKSCQGHLDADAKRVLARRKVPRVR